MKKVLIGGLLCTLFLTGCGEKTLICTKNEDLGLANSSLEVKAIFEKEGSKITKLSFNQKAEVADEYADRMDEINDYFVKYFKEYFGDVEKKLNLKYSIQGNSVAMTGGINASDLNEGEWEELFGDITSYEETKEQLEEEGYTCE